MVDADVRAKYKPTIGIECHVQLKTATKLFAAVGNDARFAEPNTLISHICLGMPGALPVLNEKAVELSTKAAFAFGTKPQRFSKFDRKHYFYPDLPKGYQITQYDEPIITGGYVDIVVRGDKKRINLTRAHLEEDAGKTTHPAGKDYSLVDLNRAGTPLLEIVSEPELGSPEEAKAFAREMYLLMRYAGVSDADLYHGNMRFDVNVSVSKGSGQMGTRTETKNLNSFKSVEKAVEFEINRQIELLEKGQRIVQETRGWDDAKQKTFSQRSKEEAFDYRYFPDPDLPPIVLDDDEVEAVRQQMPIMPGEWRERLSSLGMDTAQTETLLDGELETEDIQLLALIEDNLDDPALAKFLANWQVNILIPLLSSGSFKLNNEDHVRLELAVYKLVKDGKLSSTSAKSLFAKLAGQTELPKDIDKYAETEGYIQMSDESEIEKIVEQVINANPKAAEDVRSGEMKAIGFLVGQVMKASKGKANPSLAQELIKKQLAAK